MKEGMAILQRIDEALQAAVEPGFQDRQQAYSKDAIQSLGVRTGNIRQIAKDFYPEVKSIPLPAFLATCETLLQRGMVEHRCIAFAWAYRRRKDLEPRHFGVLLGWLSQYVRNWADCDQLCCEVFGEFMVRYPEFAPQTLDWAKSENRWLRRAASVVLIVDLRKEAKFLPLILQIAEILLPDRDDLVQKGYGWALKEAIHTHEEKVFQFILQHKAAMSRTALRYAIEKLSPAQRAEAMKP